MGVISTFLFSQFFIRPKYPTTSCAGKTVVVTGSNTGLGKEAARHFARLGAQKLILAVRNLEKGNAAKTDIEESTKCGSTVIEVWQVDMASYTSVQAFASRVNAELDRVDIFVANAGVSLAKFSMAEEDEATITINVVTTFLLVALVVPKLKETASKYKTRPTLTVTASEVHGFTQFPQKTAPEGELFATLSDESKLPSMAEQYWVSKLLEVFSIRAIAERHPASMYPVTINCVNPGLCHSELVSDMETFLMRAIYFVLARKTEVGSRTLVHAGTSGIESHGQYMSDCAVTQPAPLVLSEEGRVLQDRVWAELVTKLEAIRPGVTKNF